MNDHDRRMQHLKNPIEFHFEHHRLLSDSIIVVEDCEVRPANIYDFVFLFVVNNRKLLHVQFEIDRKDYLLIDLLNSNSKTRTTYEKLETK